MKRYLILLLSLFVAVPLAAQSRREALLEYQARRRQAYAEFQDNYRKACADFMRKRWEAFRRGSGASSRKEGAAAARRETARRIGGAHAGPDSL